MRRETAENHFRLRITYAGGNVIPDSTKIPEKTKLVPIQTETFIDYDYTYELPNPQDIYNEIVMENVPIEYKIIMHYKLNQTYMRRIYFE